ncbi:hypothetical protein DIS24_g6714 [Lasiodiplodia hormozganensis]|uniref:DUF7918 domain-containing protein n=1 Tax=Lasiodiplodia hormozganensis TaxID=869390 RepID=A0AA39YDL6_9PEZI|nr:hypothetical protein DIS24_g6714 [Lasiodiplodia hormozganensis]
MAILPDRPGIEVTVRIHDPASTPNSLVSVSSNRPKTPTPPPDAFEYPSPSHKDRANSITRYIEAIPDADFSVVIKFTARNAELEGYSLGLCIYVDGIRVQGSVIDLKGHASQRECWYVCDGAMGWEGGRWVQRSLRFEGLNVDKNARESLYHRQFEKLQCLGEIKARFYRVQEVGRIPHRDCPSPTSPNGLVKFNRVAEKALKEKAIDLQATMGDVKRTFGRCGRVLTEQIDPTDEPWAEFTFNYRSWEALEEEGILPKSAPPATTFDFLN